MSFECFLSIALSPSLLNITYFNFFIYKVPDIWASILEGTSSKFRLYPNNVKMVTMLKWLQNLVDLDRILKTYPKFGWEQPLQKFDAS